MSKKVKVISTSEEMTSTVFYGPGDYITKTDGKITVEENEWIRIHDGKTPGGNALPLSGSGATDQVGYKSVVYKSVNDLAFSDYSVIINGYQLLFSPGVGDYIITAEGKRLVITNSYWDEGLDQYTLSWDENYYDGHDYYVNGFWPITVYSDDYAPATTDKAWIKPDRLQYNNYGQGMKIYGGGPPANVDENHVHMTGKTGNVELFLGTDDNFVSTKEAGDVPGRIKMKSETDVSVEDTPFAFRRHGSWVFAHGDDENKDQWGYEHDIYLNVVDIDPITGDVYVGGIWNYNNNPMIMKLDRNGGLKWRKMVPENGYGEQYLISCIAYDKVNNRVGITQELSWPGPGGTYLHEFDADTGEFVKVTQIYGTIVSQNIYPMYLKYDNNGRPVIGGYTYGDAVQVSTSGQALTVLSDPNAGKNLNVDVTADGLGAYTVAAINFGGTGYNVGDKIRIKGTELNGSTPENDLILIVTSLGLNDAVASVDVLTGFSADVIEQTYTSITATTLIDNLSKAGIMMFNYSDFNWSKSATNAISNNPIWSLTSPALEGETFITGGVGVYMGVWADGGSGKGAFVNVEVDYNASTYSVTVPGGNIGEGYVDGETLTVHGSWVGGDDGTNDITFNIEVTGGQIVAVNTVAGTPLLFYVRIDAGQMGYYTDFSTSNEGRAEEVLVSYYGQDQLAVVWTPDWAKKIEPVNSSVNCLDIDEENNIYIAGSFVSGASAMKLTPTGDIVWVSSYDQNSIRSIAYCGQFVYVADQYGAHKTASYNGHTYDYIYFADGFFGYDDARIASFREHGEWYLYIMITGYGADWYTGEDYNAGKILRKMDMTGNLLWARAVGVQSYANTGDNFYAWDYNLADWEKWFAVGPYGGVIVGGGYWYSDNWYNGVAIQISTADDGIFKPIENPRVFIRSLSPLYPGPGVSVGGPAWFNSIGSALLADSSLVNAVNNGWNYDFATDSNQFRVLTENLNVDHHLLECVEGISFANGGVLSHNPIDIPPSIHDFTFSPNYYLENKDRGKFFKLNSSYWQNVTVYVPGNDVESIPVGAVYTFVNLNTTYKIQFWTNTNNDGVKIYAAGQTYSSIWSFIGIGTATLMKTGANEWLLTAPNVVDEGG